ncbi:MAG TPA: metalloregulator ArsR/SmtB family transcription factor [Phycisphaerae bacterium]|nr:metalloregulator ArsR/SmtB family transcription factor [Phycisphaerae bacterium]
MARTAVKTSRRRASVRGSRNSHEDRFAKVFAALGEPTRLRIMQILPREPICDQMYNVIELADELGLTQPTVSHHLKILSKAGVVQCRRQCNSLYFYVDQDAVIGWLKETKAKFGCENCKE